MFVITNNNSPVPYLAVGQTESLNVCGVRVISHLEAVNEEARISLV